ncbi:dimethylmenaquinone methyltransferase [Yersinia frederiksenii]|nr:dimethylmenaquinone methyltransferase [Yersinia frederiksenii]
MLKIVAFVPAKGNSDRIQSKNLAILDGEHLFKYKLRQLLDCSFISEVVLDTESDEIAELADDLEITRLKRPLELASNQTDGHDLFSWECSQIEADIYVQALCTAPFVNENTITRAIEALLNSPEHDSLVAVTNAKQYLWQNNEPLYGKGRIPNSVDLPVTTIEAMSLYIVRKSVIESGKRFGSNPILFNLSPTEAVDVNWPEDLELAETISAGYRAKENLQLAALAPYFTTSLLSDITREMGYKFTLPQEIKGEGRFLGRVKTLLLDVPTEDNDWKGIYKALDSYEFIRPNDVIIVENRVPSHAYFGNLNAQLAIRAGAIGTIVNGVTRDKTEVEKLGYPVFSRGNYCVDIKFKGTVRAMNKPITIGSVNICNGDYVLADSDGVIVIPRKLWPEVKSLALQNIEKEWNVGVSVALGIAPNEIYKNLGEF